ncbi:L-lactate dehydrogenase complex protein LldE [Faunimonas pinastri]|uniref:L-lactate dehydrogenase complex protein LldE n=1 Tax=Faunimonas pinastri TaxID=1855383 RepID=A0A1H8ZCU6_9HYPH|nr:(Fe-S)-binding protein [Faunimonas pinastri]SEP62215.1 L-lactate dehydrogenase complex protein LldE [Faunimonas pinastri]
MRVGLFPTCLVDLFRPSVGFASAELLGRAGCDVDLPEGLTCCGQPAFNSGDRKSAQALARQVIAACEGFDAIVVPSGSCGGMIRRHYPELLAEDRDWAPRARALAERTHELVSFLVDVLGVETVSAACARRATYHDACSGLRELGIKAQPRKLLESVEGLELTEMPGAEICCGFGGTFCVEYPEISNRMVSDKCVEAEASGANLLLAGDLGCLMNIAGKLSRAGSAIEVRHVAEVLAGRLDEPPIAAARGEDAR